ncbi:MAG: hypothetical protein IKS30_05265 [Treponema sp.]|nr:hypothetical protein [Treponema sp.]
MELIETLEELKNNAKMLSDYIKSENFVQKSFALELIKNGKCFVVFESDKGLEFYPSKFLGFKENNKDKHETAKKEKTIHGILSNHRIDEILKCGCMPNSSYEKEFQKFCSENGIYPKNQVRKFWLPKITFF